MKKWLIVLVGLTLAVVVTTGGGFALAGNGSDNDDQDVADEWKLVEVSAWPGGFSLRLPQGWQLNELQGIDSYVGEIIWGGGRLTFDFGWYSNSLVDDDDPQYIVTYEEIGGRRAKLVRQRAEGDGLITGVYFEDFDGSDLDSPSQNRLQISGVGLTPDQQETALAVFRTIRPLASESDDQTTVTSIDDIDPNECNWIHNISACDSPVPAPNPSYDGDDQVITDGEPYPDKGDVLGEPEPYPMPIPGETKDLTDSDVQCSTDQAVSLTSDGQVSCWDLSVPSQTDDDKDMASPGAPPIVEPA